MQKRMSADRFTQTRLENFWSLMKRNLSGTYVAVEPFHLDRYLDEQLFRSNNRVERTTRHGSTNSCRRLSASG